MCSVFHYFVYVFHLIKFVCLFVFLFLFCCYRIFLVNKDIHSIQRIAAADSRPKFLYSCASNVYILRESIINN